MNGLSTTRRRWLIGGLIASLVLNAFLAGAIASDLVHFRWPMRDRGPPQLRFELAWLKGRLPPDAMDKVEAAVAAAKPETVAHIEKLRGLRRELGALIAVAEPDRAAIDAKLGEIRTELGAMQEGVQRASTDALLALPKETRAELTKEPPR
jgi:uncharacterized membrane protein